MSERPESHAEMFDSYVVREGASPVRQRVAVLGLGNVLMGDDAIGPCVVETLLGLYHVAPEVAVVELGTPGPALSSWLSDSKAVIFVDAIGAALPPGSVQVYSGDQLHAVPPPQRPGPRDPVLDDSLGVSELAGFGPSDVSLVGIVPESCAVGVGMTRTVRAAVDSAVAAVLAQLARLGVPAVPRGGAGPAELWWEAAPLQSVPA